MQPMGMPLRILKFAIDFLARVITGFCPAICPNSTAAVSRSFTFWLASPRPMFSVTFDTRGTAIVFVNPRRFESAGTTSFLYFSCRRLGIFHSPRLLILKRRIATAANAHFGAVRKLRMSHTGLLAAPRADQHHVRNVKRTFFFQNASP